MSIIGVQENGNTYFSFFDYVRGVAARLSHGIQQSGKRAGHNLVSGCSTKNGNKTQDKGIKMQLLKPGDRLFSGAIVTQEFAENYNRISMDIEKKDKIGMNTEALKNGRHNLLNAFAIFTGKNGD